MRSGGLADRGGGTFDDSHDVGLLHDQEILAIELDLGAGPLAEQDAVALLDVERNERALLIALEDPPPGISPEEAVAAIENVLGSIGDACPECSAESG